MILHPALQSEAEWAYDLARERHPDLKITHHRQWWRKHRKEILVAREDNELVGHLRVDPDGEVHLTVSPSHRNNGIGTAMLAEVRRLGLWARVHDSNEASQRAFQKAGWAFSGDMDGMGLWMAVPA